MWNGRSSSDMRVTTGVRAFLLPFFVIVGAAAPITVDTKSLLVSVDAATCRWSAEVKGTPMRLNHVHFLPGDDPSGWTVVSSVNQDDSNKSGSFVTVTLRGKKAGQLDFEYQIYVSKTNNDILVSLSQSNNTGKAVDIADMDYFVSTDARLGGSEERWISLGTHSRNRDYYDLWSVINLNTPRMYEVNQVVRDSDTGNALLIGHVSAFKGASRFEVAAGWGARLRTGCRFGDIATTRSPCPRVRVSP